MTHRFRGVLRPLPSQPPSTVGAGFSQSISVPATVPARPGAAADANAKCSVVPSIANWLNLDAVADVTAQVTAGYGSTYADGVYTAVASASRFGAWDIDASDVDTPLLCCLVPISGDLEAQLTFLIWDALNLYDSGSPPLQPYCIIQAGHEGVLSYYGPIAPANIVGTLTWKIVCIAINPA
jgi:hypothetical protein